MNLSPTLRRFLWVSLFGVAFAFVESSVVVYLRSIYYPEGFGFPLKLISRQHLIVELAREAATVVMLAAVGVLAGSKAWERFGYFLVAFGVWDIFYYVWLKVILDWPASFTDWDILFLLPVPWIGPVIAPVLVSFLMVLSGLTIARRFEAGKFFYPNWQSWVLAILGTFAVLYSFMMDTEATMHGRPPAPYQYLFLAFSLILYVLSFLLACKPTRHTG